MEVARGELKGFLDSRAASRAANTRAETKLSAWEVKLRSLVEDGAEEERVEWAEANLRKAKAKVTEKAAAVEGFERAVRHCERQLAAVVARVKDEEVDEVVEVDVQGEMEEEASVKDEEEETKVVEAAPAGGGDERLAQGVDGVEGCGGPPGPAMGPGSPGWHPPPKPGHPPRRRPGESGMDSPVFVGAGAPPAVGGGAGYGWTGGGGFVHLDEPLRLGWSRGRGGGNVSCQGRGTRGGGEPPPPPPERRVKMFELAQTNIFSPERKKGGATHWRFVAHCWQGRNLRGVEWVGKAWVWTPTWSALLDIRGFNPEAANRGVYAGVVHGIAGRPKPKPKPAAAPAGGPRQPHPPNAADAFAKALGAIPPALDHQGTVCQLRSSVDLANRSGAVLATAVPPPLEHR